MICPKCENKTRVIDTVTTNEFTLRQLQCCGCGKTFYSKEEIVDPDYDFYSEWGKFHRRNKENRKKFKDNNGEYELVVVRYIHANNVTVSLCKDIYVPNVPQFYYVCVDDRIIYCRHDENLAKEMYKYTYSTQQKLEKLNKKNKSAQAKKKGSDEQ